MKYFLRMAVAFFMVIVLLVIALNLPPVQNAISNRIEKALSDKTNSEIHIGRVNLNLLGNVVLKNILIKNPSGEDVLKSDWIDIDLSLWPLMSRNIHVNHLRIRGFKSYLEIDADSSATNLDFLINAFSNQDSADSTQSKNWNLSVNEMSINESNFTLNILRTLELKVQLGLIKLFAEVTDVNDFLFEIRDITIKNTHVSLLLLKDSLSNDVIQGIENVSDPGPGRNVITDVQYINGTDLTFNLNLYDQFALSAEVSQFEGRSIYFNLMEQLISVSNLFMGNSTTEMNIFPAQQVPASEIPQVPDSEAQPVQTTNDLFVKNFGWDISSGRTELENCSVKYDDHTYADTLKSMDPHHFFLRDLHFSVTDAQLAEQKLTANIQNFGLSENKGFAIRDLSADMSYIDDSLSIESFHMATNNSEVQFNLYLEGIETGSHYNYPEPGNFMFNLGTLHVDSKDLDYLLQSDYPALKHIDFLDLSLAAKGKGKDFDLDDLNLSINDDISLHMTGQFQNLYTPHNICMINVSNEARINTQFLLAVIDSSELSNINLPGELVIRNQINGCLNDIHLESNLLSSLGELYLTMHYRKSTLDERDSIAVALNASDLEIGQLFNIDSLGKIDIRGGAHMTGLEDGPESFSIDLTVDTVYFNHNPLSGIHLSSNFYENDLDILLTSSDSILDFNLGINGHVIDSMLDFTTDFEIRQLDLQRIGFMEDPFKVSAHISSKDKIGKGMFEGTFELPDLVITSAKSYALDSIHFYLLLKEDSVSMRLKSRPLQGEFASNIPFDELGSRMVDFYGYHFLSNDTIPTPEASGNLEFKFMSNVPLENLTLLVPGLEEFQFDRIEGKLNESDRTSSFDLFIPRITFREITLDSVAFNMKSSPEYLSYHFNLPSTVFEEYNIKNLSLSGQTVQGSVNNVLTLKGDSILPILRTGFTIDHMTSDDFLFHLNPDSLIIDSKIWEVRGDNEIWLVKNEGVSGNIQITDGQQAVLILSSDTLHQVNITELQLSYFNRLIQNFNPSFKIAGELNMKANIELYHRTPQVSVDIKMADFSFQNTSYGNINIRMENDVDNNISGELFLVNGDNTLSMEGKYDFSNIERPIRADVDIDLNQLTVFNSFGNNFIDDPHGHVTGHMSILGDKKSLNVNGKLDFNSVNFLLTPVNSRYQIENESITIANNQLNFGDFTMLDSAGNSFMMSGQVQYKPISTFNMDLRLKADRFTFYNTTKSSNPNLYGKLIMSMDANIKGSTENPNIMVTMSIDDGTNMVYALPPKNFDLVDSEGIVEFVNFSEEDSIWQISLEQQVGDTLFSKLNWLDLNAVLNINKAAQFMIDMDPVSGDYIQFGGAGNLNFVVQQNQTPQVSGSYVFDRGIYEVSFYGLVKKTFRFQPGSSITWSGDPFGALLNLNASYTIRTASVGLVSREIYGLSDEERNQYRRALPYSVGIGIKGQLDNPVIGFLIDLPEEDKSAFPLVESKLNLINDPGHESELTRQVFGLLTIGSFIPETTGPGSTSSYGSALATTAAANSLNAILTGELNKLSGKYIKFVDLDIGMQTYSDLEGGGQSTRTTMDVRLSKKLFDDRVTIEAQGSFDLQNESKKYMQASEQSDVYSDFAIIYDLTEKGDYKLKAFQRSAYDIIYKNTQIGGVAVIFIKEFDTYRQERKFSD